MTRKSWPRTRRKGFDSGEWSRPHRQRFAISCRIIYSILIAAWMTMQEGSGGECPASEKMPGCPCYNFEDGLFLECPGATEDSLKSALVNVISAAKSKEVVVQSLSVYELDRKVEELKATIFPLGSQIKHLQISHSGLREIDEDAFDRLGTRLQSLGIVSGQLQAVPQKALTPLTGLTSLDLEANQIRELPRHSFFGLSLIKLNLKGNEIAKISEDAFAGLEASLTDLDLSENKIRIFPMTSLRRVENLLSLKLAWNDVSHLPEDGYSRLDTLNYLDLSSNNFQVIPLNCFRCCPVLRTLSLSHNSANTVDKDAFISLIHLESIDLSHNKIIFLDVATFRANPKLRSIDLSHNHLHYIRGIFARLPELKELFLADNNILEIPAEAFLESISLSVLYLQQNAIRRIDSRGLATLGQLAQLHLSDNFIERVPRGFLDHCDNLSTLSLDGNRIRDLEAGTFSKSKQLRELRLQDNQITEVRRGVFAPLPTLLELHLQNNAITDMETGALKSLHNLQHINLQGNLLAVLGDVFQVSFDSTGSLVSIQLDNNGLGVLHNDSLRGQTSVRIMWLGHNRMTRLQAPLFRDLVVVERLYLTNNSISRIEDTAFQPMQALKFLELSMNRLSHVTGKTFSELHDLEELYLQDNVLRKLDPYALTALKRLRILDLANNYLGELHSTMFQESLSIRTLNLKNCTIRIMEAGVFKGLTNLYELNLEDNHLTALALDILDIPGLRILKISNNDFSEIDGESLNGMPSLQQLSMERSQIHRLSFDTFSNNKHLGKILLGNNQLHSLPGTLFSGLDSLREVKLDGNRFQEMPYEVFINTTTIEFLSLSNNVILHIDTSRLNGLRNLRELDLRGNHIISVSGFSDANFSRLISIDLSHNHLTALPMNFFVNANQLRKVELSGNKLRQLPGVALSARNMPNLGWLNLTGNPLTRVHEFSSEDKYPSLEEIHISRTNLTMVTGQDFEAFPGLLHLYVNNNLISRVSPSAFQSLRDLLTLDLSANDLELMPQARLKGLERLKLLNLTRNHLKTLEDFPEDLKALRVLDLSYNEIQSIGENTFNRLGNLLELYLDGNWLATVSSGCFASLKKLRVLDVSGNSLEYLPLNAFQPLETQIRSLRVEENPLRCGCEAQELWEWLRDHQKLIRGSRERDKEDGMGVSDGEGGLLRCQEPIELRGLVFLDLDPHSFCSEPLIVNLIIQDVRDSSVIILWQSRNHSGLHGYQVAYHDVDKDQEIHGKILEPTSRSIKLSNLSSNTQYLICIVGLGNWLPQADGKTPPGQFNSSVDDLVDPSSLEMLDSPTSRCTKVKTLEKARVIVVSGDGAAMSDSSGAKTVLTRRLGLIVGCCMGFVVFILLVSVLGYLKVKKQREAVKRDQQTVPPEYISYRHFSIQSGDAGHNNRVNNNQDAEYTSGYVNNEGHTTLTV
ncbi:chaoptin [Fopius arisanus]|uniref:Chaoptin n=1 Tax=Fopius arisanus TaxID=64838 RepID=A0A9R1T355_9HYME|nr:PREDICTED: chaoptin-like [Fopius arisanus]